MANTTVGVIREVKGERAITALSELAAPQARVIRDGTQRDVPAAGLVAGDLLVLAEGDIVPADARIVEAAALLVDEAALPANPPRCSRTPAPARTARPPPCRRGRLWCGAGAEP